MGTRLSFSVMYASFLCNQFQVQPIGAFATRNAASGSALHKVVLEAIVKLEGLGAEVLNVVCDGSTPNRSFWRKCGIGEVNGCFINKVSFSHSVFHYA